MWRTDPPDRGHSNDALESDDPSASTATRWRLKRAQIIRADTQRTISGPAGPIATWPEPDLDDTVEKLEWAYQNRDALGALGRQAGKDLAGLTWTESARRFLSLMQ